MEDGPGAAIFLPCGGELQRLSDRTQRDLQTKLANEASKWLGFCDSARKSKDAGDAQLLVISRRCMAPSWVALSYVRPVDKDQRRMATEKLCGVAGPSEHHPDVYRWLDEGGPGMDTQNEPAIAKIIGIPPDTPLPLDVCIAIGGLIITYSKAPCKVNKSSRQLSSSDTASGSNSGRSGGSVASSFKSKASSLWSSVSRNSGITQSTQRPGDDDT